MSTRTSRRRFLTVVGGSLALAIPGVGVLEWLEASHSDNHWNAKPHLPARLRATFGISHPLTDATPANQSLHALEDTLGYRFPLIGVFYSFDSTWRQHSLSTGDLVGRTLMVTWLPSQVAATVKLTDIVAGKFDDRLDDMIGGMRNHPGQVIVRWAHEMNGNWSPWSVQYANPDLDRAAPTAQEYIDAWRYVVARERRLEGTSNIRWFWCANSVDAPGKNGAVTPMEQYWPGSSWVDIAGCDAYNFPPGWRSFDVLIEPAYTRIALIAPDRPFWVGETGCYERDGDQQAKGSWISDMLSSQAFGALETICYFDYDKASVEGVNWTLLSSPSTTTYVASVLSQTQPLAVLGSGRRRPI